MQKRKRQPPTYRQRTGYDQAIVTLTDSVTGYRKDNRLGPYGSPAMVFMPRYRYDGPTTPYTASVMTPVGTVGRVPEEAGGKKTRILPVCTPARCPKQAC